MSERFFARATPPLPPFGGQTLSLACVMKTLSPQTTGVELPESGSAAFQRTFSVGLHLTGTFFSPLCPWPVEPRQAGQSSATAKEVRRRAEKRVERVWRMGTLLRKPLPTPAYPTPPERARFFFPVRPDRRTSPPPRRDRRRRSPEGSRWTSGRPPARESRTGSPCDSRRGRRRGPASP